MISLLQFLLLITLCTTVLGLPYFLLTEEIYVFQNFSSQTKYTDNATEIIRKYGYLTEEHYVQTPDGYSLCLIRLQNPNISHHDDITTTSSSSASSPKVVFLQHGLLDSAHTFINNLRNESLAFILADSGFDVWLGNSRGSTYSRGHVTLNPNDTRYWDFSWDEMASMDLPTSLYYVLNKTGVSTLRYVGHSQGSQIALAQFSRDVELQSRVSVFIALAPVAYLGHVKSPIRYIAPYANSIVYAIEYFGTGEFLPSSKLFLYLTYILCPWGHHAFMCENIIFMIIGFDAKNTNASRLPFYLSHTPAGTSAKNMVHYCQGIQSDKFQHFDYGAKENMKLYGQRTPPTYDLSKIHIPTAVFYGGSDWLAVRTDINVLLDKLSHTLIGQYYYENYNHLDFVWGVDTGYVLYPAVGDILSRY